MDKRNEEENIEMWISRRMLRISWTEKKTNESIGLLMEIGHARGDMSLRQRAANRISSFTLHSSFCYFYLKSPLIICSIQFRCLVLIIVNRDLPSSTSCNTSSFDMCSVQLIFSPYTISTFQKLPIF